MLTAFPSEEVQRPDRALGPVQRRIFSDAYRTVIRQGGSEGQAVEAGYRALDAAGRWWGREIPQDL